MQKDTEITDLEIREFHRCILRGNNIEELYHLYGPSNPIRRSNLCKNDVNTCKNSPNGICHMMTCLCHETEKDWFTGRCDIEDCNNIIDKKSNAWRIARYEGGFEGCFCSKMHADLCFIEDEFGIYAAISKVMYAIRSKYPIYEKEETEVLKEEEM